MYRETASWPASEQACYLNVGKVDELGLCDGLICLPEHALLEQQPALLQILLLAVLHFIQHICYVLVIIQQHVLIWVGLAHVSLVVHCLHHTAVLNNIAKEALQVFIHVVCHAVHLLTNVNLQNKARLRRPVIKRFWTQQT